MKPYAALIANDLRLALRDRTVIFFNYLFPLVFFFGFGGIAHADRSPGTATLVVTSVLVIGVLGNGLFGAGLRAVQDREAGILRRFKVAPISHVHLSAPGGVYADPRDYGSPDVMPRALAQYLYAGVTAVKSVGDPLDTSLAVRGRISRGEILGAEFFVSGPMFTADGRHGTEYAQYLPANMRDAFNAQVARTPKSGDEARQFVRELNAVHIDGLKAIVEAGIPGRLFERIDAGVLKAIGDEARAVRLPLVVHTGNSRDVADALDAGASGIEHGPRERIPDELLHRMKASGAAYDPTLSVYEAQAQLAAGQQDLLDRSLVQQTIPPRVLTPTRGMLRDGSSQDAGRASAMRGIVEVGRDNLKRAYDAGVLLVTGSDAGNLLVFHGPTIQHELQLWVDAGIPPAAALQAATWNAARLLHADSRIGLIAPGHDADLLIVDGNPLTDIAATERISMVVFKGERIRRADLFREGQIGSQ